MNRYRDFQFPTFFPDRIHSRIVDGHQFAALVFDAQAPIFENFQSARPAAHRVIQLRDHFLAEFRIVDLAPVHLCENYKTVGIWLDHFVQYRLQFFSPEAGKDHDLPYVGLVHALHDLGGWHFVAMNSSRVVHMVVDVDDVELGSGYRVILEMDHGLRIPVLQQECHAFVGVGGLPVLDVLRQRRHHRCG